MLQLMQLVDPQQEQLEQALAALVAAASPRTLASTASEEEGEMLAVSNVIVTGTAG